MKIQKILLFSSLCEVSSVYGGGGSGFLEDVVVITEGASFKNHKNEVAAIKRKLKDRMDMKVIGLDVRRVLEQHPPFWYAPHKKYVMVSSLADCLQKIIATYPNLMKKLACREDIKSMYYAGMMTCYMRVMLDQVPCKNDDVKKFHDAWVKTGFQYLEKVKDYSLDAKYFWIEFGTQENKTVLFEEMVKKGYKWANYSLGHCYECAKGEKQNVEKALTCYLEAANVNHPGALYAMADHYEDWDSNDPDYKKAFEYYLRSAQQGYAEAQYKVGRFYELELGVDEDIQNTENAKAWYELAAAQGHKKAVKDLDSLNKPKISKFNHIQQFVPKTVKN